MIFANTTKLKATLGAGFVGILMTLNPATCRAQMEINPDHYDTSGVSTTTTKSKTRADLNHAAPQKPSAGTRQLRSKRVSRKRQPVQLSAKTASAVHSWDVR